MSKLSDYSKFDRIDSDSEDDDDNNKFTSSAAAATKKHEQISSTSSPHSASAPVSPQQAPQQQQQQQPMKVGGTTKKGKDGRYVFEMNGRKIYEWDQSLEEINLYIEAPPNVTAQQIICNIQTNRLQLGLRNHDRFFINERTYSKVKSADSSWYLDNDDDGIGIIHIILAKVFRGETWEGVLMGPEEQQQQHEKGGDNNNSRGGEVVDPFTKQQMQQDLMRERFQEENPGFDFRDATFNGEAPDPRTFMGGVRYD